MLLLRCTHPALKWFLPSWILLLDGYWLRLPSTRRTLQQCWTAIYIYIYICWNAASFVTAGLLAAFLFVLLQTSGVCSPYVLLALLPSHEVPFLVQGPGQRSQCFAPFTAILHSIVPAILEVNPSFSYVSTALLLLILALQSCCRNWCCCWFCCVSLVRSLGCFALLLHFQYSDR